ncbi:MAG TPA: response regulator transcription factor [Bryobacteraceae bacterium]|nr:response regulator transcription factor [Bryobacteraceae bacterium]
MSKAIRVAIVEDDAALRLGLGRIIDAADGFHCAATFASAEDALAHLSNLPCDVLLLDIQLPGMSGSEAVPQLRQECPNLKILMLTVFSDENKVFSSICNGASGYLLKTTPPAQLLEAIAAAHEGGAPLSPQVARQIVALFQKTGPPEPPAAPLSPQERRLLSLLAEGYGYSGAAERMEVSINTIRNYIRSVYEKLHVHSKSEAVGAALRQGLIR